MKYILHEMGDAPGEGRMIVCDTREQRDKRTIEAIYGSVEDADAEAAKNDLDTLREHGRITFEGDPGLEWIEVCEVVGPNT